MKKIIVAGAGHGGLSAAATLAKNGYSVSVYEKADEEKLGHDWHDGCEKSAFRFADIPVPEKDKYNPCYDMTYYSPSHKVKIERPLYDPDDESMMIDRRVLLKHLVSYAKQCGVEFHFGTEIKSAVTKEHRVTGIVTEKDGMEETVYGDLIIDSAGMDSPVRSTLPEEFAIQNVIPPEDSFHVYRAYYENTTGECSEPKYTVFFYNCGVPGISWSITEPGYVDILIGKFGEMTDEEFNMCIDDMKKLYPYMGDKIIRGGYFAKIPLIKTLSKIVADGYAAIGDCAGMTVPMNGCGISLSLKAGKILANAIIADRGSDFTIKELWRYQYNYYKLCGESLAIIAKAREYFCKIDADTVNFCVERGIVGSAEMDMVNGDFSAVSLEYIMNKIKAVAPKAYKLPQIIAQFRTVPAFNSVFNEMPFEYDEEKFNEWRKKYDKL